MDVPILLLAFNRPDTTKQVFDSIRNSKPSKLYIAQDGPRNIKDKELIDEVRKIFLIDRECDVHYLCREANLWCRDAVVGWIDWFFDHEKFGIILEDDCIMWSQFPEFCAKCDELYANNSIIWSISGSNYVKDTRDKSWDYFFTSHHPLLRWRATRKDRRQNYQHDTQISSVDKNIWKSNYKNHIDRAIERYWKWWYRDSNRYSLLHNNHLLTIIPTVNLITNIGHIWIHNERAWSFHDLAYDSFNHPLNELQVKNWLSYQKYDTAMKKFIFKLYFYTKIGIFLKRVWLYEVIHRLFLFFILLLQKIWLK